MPKISSCLAIPYPTPPRPYSQVSESLHQLLEIVSAYESALETTPAPPSRAGARGPSGSGTPLPSDEAGALPDGELGPVLAAVLDPLVEACVRSAEALTPDAPTRVDEYAKLDPTAHK